MKAVSSPCGEHRILIAGFGGQGVLTAGKLLCTSAISEGLQVTYLPAYGSEVRGGTANCHVVISPQPIFSPYVERADILIMLNQLSLERFVQILKPSGCLLVNSSLVQVDGVDLPGGLQVWQVPATEKALAMGNVLVANVVMLGAFAEVSGALNDQTFKEALERSLGGKKSKLITLNLEAFKKGRALAREAAHNG